jgi:hypothetical protein
LMLVSLNGLNTNPADAEGPESPPPPPLSSAVVLASCPVCPPSEPMWIPESVVWGPESVVCPAPASSTLVEISVPPLETLQATEKDDRPTIANAKVRFFISLTESRETAATAHEIDPR